MWYSWDVLVTENMTAHRGCWSRINTWGCITHSTLERKGCWGAFGGRGTDFALGQGWRVDQASGCGRCAHRCSQVGIPMPFLRKVTCQGLDGARCARAVPHRRLSRTGGAHGRHWRKVRGRVSCVCFGNLSGVVRDGVDPPLCRLRRLLTANQPLLRHEKWIICLWMKKLCV